MQKKISATPIVAVAALFTGYNICQGQSAEAISSDSALANVETSAKGGDEPGTHNHGPTRNLFSGKNIVEMRIRQIVLIRCVTYCKY